ncbi:MAG: WYL domain-containing protein [Bacteroidales bacterium]|nr:WYL domain-containing protein [Bacteroidales bacterium]
MPANKNALIRYKTIDKCLCNRYRRWTLDDLVDACCEALYEAEGMRKGVSVRTVQGDIQMMRSDKLGYNAPIEVYDGKYYRYADAGYSITNLPMSRNDYEMLRKAVDMMRQMEDFDHFAEMSDVVGRLRDKLAVIRSQRKPIIHFESVSNLMGLKLLNPLYNYVSQRQSLRIVYHSFSTSQPFEYDIYPYLLKEYRNRWYLYGSQVNTMRLYNLALDRIISVTPLEVPFRDNPDFDPDHFFDDLIGVSKNLGDYPRTIRFWASARQSNYIITKPLHRSQKLLWRNPEDGSCVFRINVVINVEMYSMFLSFGEGVRILHPPRAVKYMKNQARGILNMYEDTSDATCSQ